MNLRIAFDPVPQITEHFELRTGWVDPTGEPVVRRSARTSEGLRRIHAEVNAGNRLAALPDTTYPAQLARVVGHDLTGPRPHVTTTYRGTPIVAQTGPPPPQAVLTIFGDLLVAVQALAKAGMTHGAIVPESVHWDGDGAQLVNLGDAVAVGEPVHSALPAVWLPPPGRDGLRLAAQAHDVYQIGLVVFCVATGRNPLDAAALRATVAQHPALSALLDGVFADDPQDRPDPSTLQRRIDEARSSPAWNGAELHTAPIRIPQQPVYDPPIPARPVSRARQEFRQQVEAKRLYRQQREQPSAVAYRFVRQLLEILWYGRTSVQERLVLVGGVALVVVLPVVLVIVVVMRLFGGSE